MTLNEQFKKINEKIDKLEDEINHLKGKMKVTITRLNDLDQSLKRLRGEMYYEHKTNEKVHI